MKYYWYKLESMFGPGHQSTETKYFYETKELDPKEYKEYEYEEAHRIANLYDTHCSTEMSRADTVPDDEIAHMRDEAIRRRAAAEHLITALNELEKAQHVDQNIRTAP